MTANDPHDHRELLARSLAAIDELEAKLDESERRRHEPIAVVGMGLRFPGGARDPESFWELLMSGRDAVTEIPADRWDLDAMFDPDPGAPGKAYTRWGAFLDDDIAGFDPGLFGISPREAISMDPQQRLLLEVAWEALEHAGVAAPELAGTSTGVFLGMIGTEYADLALQGGIIPEVDAYFASGVSQSVAAGRLAYVFDLQGPAIAVDTACSSSLVATHLACQSLRAGECDAALAGGVNVMLSPDAHIVTSQARMMSFEGRCKTFDASADGYVRGEGCAVLVLKRLSDAVAAGDRILATIVGTSANQDGRSNGLTAPSAAAQEAVIRHALADAGVEPGEVDFVECHGTGTTLGDPIEVRALQAVFGSSRQADRPLAVQSVKTNIGHLEAAAGIAGLCKLVLAVQHGALPRHLHLVEPSPYIPWRDIVVTPEPGPRPWEVDEGAQRVGGISSFGFSGTNVHMVVRQAPSPALTTADAVARPCRVYPVSARTTAALHALARAHGTRLAQADAGSWPQLAATATTGRAHLDERLAVVATSAEEAARQLTLAADGAVSADVLRGRAGPVEDGVVMLFTGQGSQVPGMGRRLFETEPAFRATLERCSEVLRDLAGMELLEVMFTDEPAQGRSLHDTRFTQPALFAYEVALAELWRSWGITPAAVLGHSIGELAAAHVAGVIDLEDGLRLVEARGRLMQELPRDGGMAAVLTDEATVRNAIAPWSGALSVAAVNGPRNVVVSGRTDALEAALTELRATGAKVVPLEVSHAFHSPLMDPMLDAFTAVVASVELHEPDIELISNRTGAVADPGLLTTPAYWREHVREAVRFEASIRHAVDLGYRTFLEVGPSPTLTAMARACDLPPEVGCFAARRNEDEARELHRTVAALHVAGIPLDWRGYEGRRRTPVTLPAYPFEHQRYWHPRVDADHRAGRVAAPTEPNQLAGRRLRSPRLDGVVFERELAPSAPAWLADHVIHGATIVPAAAYLELMRRVGEEAQGRPVDVTDVRVEEPLLLGLDRPTVVQTIVDERGQVEVVSADGDHWRRHAHGWLRPTADDGSDTPTAELEPPDEPGWQAVDGGDYYRALERIGVAYGPSFRRVVTAERRDGHAIATVRAVAGEDEPGAPHPALVDAGLQALGLAMPGGADLDHTGSDAYLPVGVERWHVVRAPDGPVTAEVRLRPASDGASAEVVIGDVHLRDSAGELLARLDGVRLKRAPRTALPSSASPEQDWSYTVHWTPAPLPDGAGRPIDARWLVVGRGPLAEAVASGLAEAGAGGERVDTDPLASVGAITAAVGHRLGEAKAGLILVLPLSDEPGAFDAAVAAALATSVTEREATASLTIVTQDAMAVVAGDGAPGHAQAAAWGVGRVAAAEHRRWSCRLLDVSATEGGGSGSAVRAVLSELGAGVPQEQEVAWRAGVRYVPRLERLADRDALPAPEGPYCLEISERGRLDALHLVPQGELEPGAGEVLIDVHATGLNFRDVLLALGTYAGDATALGSECAGIVVATGAGVTRVRPGDRVMAVASGAFASRCLAPEQLVARQPHGWSDSEAATVPIAFLTAVYALDHLGGLRDGQRVLIHAAAGGVGMAAVQLAQRAGAEIFATAGSDVKRGQLRALGVQHVYDSRSVAFRDEILRDTDGRGVDLVLSSLSGDAIGASVDVLAPGGTFLEIGLAGIWEEERFLAARPDATYHVIYLGDVCAEQPELIARMLDDLSASLERGEVRALPLTAFDVRDSATAFRFMAQARHTGKVVVTAARGWALDDASGSWIVTGGLGGLGLEVAAGLVSAGASRVVLGSRRPVSAAPEVVAAVAELRAGGTEIWTVELDVADGDAVAAMVKEVTADGLPLRGVIHAAGVLDDGLLRDLTAERFSAVMTPKLLGAQHLAAATDPHHPEHFVLFSAGAGLLGAPGQGTYAAANTAVDALAHARRAEGRPALVVDWGPWSGVGMAARLGDDALRRWEAQGIVALQPDEGRRALRAAMRDGTVQQAILKLRWPALLHHFSKHPAPAILTDLIRSEQRRTVAADGAAEAAGSLVDELGALPVERRHDRLAREVREQVLRVLGLDVAYPIDPHQGLSDVGMDSLMAVELSNRLSVLVDRSLPSTLTFEHPTLEDLTIHVGDLLADRVELTPPIGSATTGGPMPAAADDLAGLTPDELTDALMRELDDAGY